MTNSKVNTLTIVLVLILVAGGIFFAINQRNQKVDTSKFETEIATYCEENAVVDPTCVAFLTNNPSICDRFGSMQNEQSKETCYDELILFKAVKNKDSSLCSGIKRGDMKISCLTYLSKDKSVCTNDGNNEEICEILASANAELCTNVGAGVNFKESFFDEKTCYDGMVLFNALSDNNLDLCDEISHKSNKNLCKAFINNDTKFCNKALTECYDSQLAAYARNNTSLALCDKISNEALKPNCYDDFYEFKAAATKNAALCKNIKNQTSMERCLNIAKK